MLISSASKESILAACLARISGVPFPTVSMKSRYGAKKTSQFAGSPRRYPDMQICIWNNRRSLLGYKAPIDNLGQRCCRTKMQVPICLLNAKLQPLPRHIVPYNSNQQQCISPTTMDRPIEFEAASSTISSAILITSACKNVDPSYLLVHELSIALPSSS